MFFPLLQHSARSGSRPGIRAIGPSSRIMWGTDCNHAEGIYGATEFTRRCLAEVLAERRERGELTEEHARRIGKQILRDNALTLFPQLKERLWKRKGKPIRPKTKEIKLCTRTGSIVGWPPG